MTKLSSLLWVCIIQNVCLALNWNQWICGPPQRWRTICVCADVRTGCGRSDAHKAANLCNIVCTVNTQHTARQDAIITIGLYLATRFGRKRPSSSELRTVLMYITDSTQWDPTSFALNLSFNVVINWPADGRTRPKLAAKYYLTVIISSCLHTCCIMKVSDI